MARFTAQGRLKPFLNNDGVSIGFEFKLGAGGCGLRFVDGFSVPVQIQERKLSSCKSTSRMHASSSSVHKPKHLNTKKSAEPSISKQEILEEIIMDDDPDFEEDELSCFRGLVLDISYRSFPSLFPFPFPFPIVLEAWSWISTYLIWLLLLVVLTCNYWLYLDCTFSILGLGETGLLKLWGLGMMTVGA